MEEARIAAEFSLPTPTTTSTVEGALKKGLSLRWQELRARQRVEVAGKSMTNTYGKAGSEHGS